MPSLQPCRHCGGQDLFSFTVQAGGTTGSLLPVGALHGPKYENRVCGDCGYTEWFVAKEHLQLVREKFARAGSSGRTEA
ncbi:hypothetical protein ACS5PN_13530 [Roseateles sp. NT4]|uniref:hypothetical protein n=1 Tax=Roseateles sp. NT4 TaxID=3453715 RepID=UPI003EEC2A89